MYVYLGRLYLWVILIWISEKRYNNIKKEPSSITKNGEGYMVFIDE